jgi:hypothetical protein
LESWAAWCHERNLKSELQRDLNLAADRIEKMEAWLMGRQPDEQRIAELTAENERLRKIIGEHSLSLPRMKARAERAEAAYKSSISLAKSYKAELEKAETALRESDDDR